MTRVPPIVLPVGALLALVVALSGLAMDWAEVTPVAFFLFIFCTILASMRIAIATMEPYVPPTTEEPSTAEPVASAVVYDVEEEQAVAPYVVDEATAAPSAVDEAIILPGSADGARADDEQPQRPV